MKERFGDIKRYTNDSKKSLDEVYNTLGIKEENTGLGLISAIKTLRYAVIDLVEIVKDLAYRVEMIEKEVNLKQ